jgi:hypothetical protein
MPLQTGEVMILRGWAVRSSNRYALALTAQAQVLQRQAGAFFQALPGFDRRLAIGLRRQHQDGFGRLLGSQHDRLSLADTRFDDRAQRGFQGLDFFAAFHMTPLEPTPAEAARGPRAVILR